MWQSSSLVSAELSALLRTWKLWDRLHDGTPLLLQIIWEKCTEPQTEGGREGLDGRGGGEGGARCHQREGSVWLWRKEPFFSPSLLSTAGSYALGNFCSPQKCLRHPVCAGKCPEECVRIKGRTHILGNTPSQHVSSPTTGKNQNQAKTCTQISLHKLVFLCEL